MSSDLIALVVAVTLGIAVVILGLRRNLSETTRNGLPRFGGDPERATATLGLYEGGERRRHPLSPRQRRWMSGGFLLLGLAYAVMALLWANDRLIHAVFAALWGDHRCGVLPGKVAAFNEKAYLLNRFSDLRDGQAKSGQHRLEPHGSSSVP